VADALLGVAPLVTRWIERRLARHEPPLTPAQYLALRAIAQEELGGSELARRTGVSSSAVSQPIATLSDADSSSASRGGRPPAPGPKAHAPGKRTLESARNALQVGLLDVIAEADLPPPEAHALARGLPHLEATLPVRRHPGGHLPTPAGTSSLSTRSAPSASAEGASLIHWTAVGLTAGPGVQQPRPARIHRASAH
jgi:MarR family